ncbi:MAG: hypothetical protein DCC68_05410 [Planctomycetota bacterium]|nr:MAG: hypothetical protein DCC68_05410 [Planctomycetota bacterium]
MRYIGIALVSIIAGIGGGLLTYGITQPSWERAAEIVANSSNPNVHILLSNERNRADDRSALMGVGVGFLACGAAAVALSFLTTIVDYNLAKGRRSETRAGGD